MAFKEEILGRRVEVEFDDAGEFYAGTICKVQLELQLDETITSKHFIVFDDGDRKWLDVAAEEKAGQLKFIKKIADTPEKRKHASIGSGKTIGLQLEQNGSKVQRPAPAPAPAPAPVPMPLAPRCPRQA